MAIYPYGSYEITLASHSYKRHFVLVGRDESRPFFEQQLLLLEENKDLYKDLQNLLERL